MGLWGKICVSYKKHKTGNHRRGGAHGTSEMDHWTRLFAHAVLRKRCFRLLILISSEIHFAINSLNKSFSPADVHHSRLHEALAFCFKTGGDGNKHSARRICCRPELAVLRAWSRAAWAAPGCPSEGAAHALPPRSDAVTASRFSVEAFRCRLLVFLI